MKRWFRVLIVVQAFVAAVAVAEPIVQEYPLPKGDHPHDVAPAADGGVWYTAQHSGALGWLDPKTGDTRHIPLGEGSRPHGVIVGLDGAPWITDSGLNAIVRVDPGTFKVRVFAAPEGTPYMNLNTASFDFDGVLWFTGQAGYYGHVDAASGTLKVFEAPRGSGPYGIATAPDGSVYYASLAGSHIARINVKTGRAQVIEPPTKDQGARRVWADSKGNIWVSEWHAGKLARYTPATQAWREWRLPGDDPHAYAVYVDEHDIVWVSDFGANAIVRFDPNTEQFKVIGLPSAGAKVRQILGRPGEVWLPESGVDKLAVILTAD
ncbi:MAG: lyase [Gammaproteobacteria bacterium]|jgi:virginiamycin B lyase